MDHAKEFCGRCIRRIGYSILPGRSQKKGAQRGTWATKAEDHYGDDGHRQQMGRWRRTVRSDRGRSPRNDDDKGDRRKRQKTTFVAAEFTKGRDSGYRGNHDWKSKSEEKPINEQLDEYCTIHAYRDKQTGELKANHTLRN